MHSRKGSFPTRILIPFLGALLLILSGCAHTPAKNADALRPRPIAQDGTTRISGTFVCDPFPSNILDLTLNGTFTVREDGNIIAGAYVFYGGNLILVPNDGSPNQTGLFDGNGFIDPHGTHWTRTRQ